MYLQKEFEERIKNLPSVYPESYEDNPDAPYEPKIAIINFAFNNAKIIEMLRERGSYVKSEDWKNLRNINQNMCKLFHEKNA